MAFRKFRNIRTFRKYKYISEQQSITEHYHRQSVAQGYSSKRPNNALHLTPAAAVSSALTLCLRRLLSQVSFGVRPHKKHGQVSVAKGQQMDALESQMSEMQWIYGDKDPVALAILEKRISETGRKLSLITYTDLVKGVEFHLPNINNGSAYSITTYDWSGLDRKIIGEFLGYASYRSYSKHRFMISALVVNRDEFRPSWHFFQWMKHLNVLPDLEEDTVNAFWVDQINKAHNWYKANRRRI